MKVRLSLITLASVAVIGVANAQVIDGSLDSVYGAPTWTQTLQTQFGDSTSGLIHQSNGGSEIDGVYGFVGASGLNLLVTGNLEANFNKLVLFIDTGVGGENTIGATQGSTDDSNFVSSLAGYKFDAGFNASRVVWFRQGGTGSSAFVSLASMGASGADLANGSVAITAGVAPVISATGLTAAFNHSNIAGVTGGTGPSSGAGVTTGFEMNISLANLGLASAQRVRVAGFVIGGGNFLSNQVIGGLPDGTGNLGGGQPDFSTISGNQFVEVVPEPMTMSVLALAALAARRRRKAKKS